MLCSIQLPSPCLRTNKPQWPVVAISTGTADAHLKLHPNGLGDKSATADQI